MAIRAVSAVNYKAQSIPTVPQSSKRQEFIEDAKSKISKTGLITGSAGFILTALALTRTNKLGLIGKLLTSAVVGTISSAAGMFVRSNRIFNSPEYKKLFFMDYGTWTQSKKV